jgi:hypothetical protein
VLDSVGLARSANGPGVAAAGGRATSARALGSRCRRSGDIGAGSGVVAVGGRATSVRAPGSGDVSEYLLHCRPAAGQRCAWRI